MANLFPIPTRTQAVNQDGTLSAEFTRWLQETLLRLTRQTVGLPVYADNAAAVAGGLKAGDLYRTGADPDVLCVVH